MRSMFSSKLAGHFPPAHVGAEFTVCQPRILPTHHFSAAAMRPYPSCCINHGFHIRPRTLMRAAAHLSTRSQWPRMRVDARPHSTKKPWRRTRSSGSGYASAGASQHKTMTQIPGFDAKFRQTVQPESPAAARERGHAREDIVHERDASIHPRAHADGLPFPKASRLALELSDRGLAWFRT
jgi:hypothetical protein